jgi:DNA-binding LacI/PurR family transcriptional regulator
MRQPGMHGYNINMNNLKDRRVTIKDIAKYSGYSIATVSRVLNESGTFYSEETYSKVKKAISDLNYQPNAIARGLKTRKTFNIAFIEPWNSEFFAEIFSGIQDAANENGYSVSIFISNFDVKQEERNINTVLANRLDGVIMASAVLDANNVERLKAQNIPLVIIEKFIIDEDIPTISIKNLKISKQAVNYLISLGHKNVGFMGEPLEVGKVDSRFRGYKKALEDSGIPFNQELVFVDEKFRGEKFSSSYDYIVSNIERIKKCNALFITSDKIAVTVIKALKNHGISVPEGMSVIGFDGLEISRFINPALTTVVQPKYEMGYEAMKLLLKVINGQPCEDIELKAELLIGESTGKASNT